MRYFPHEVSPPAHLAVARYPALLGVLISFWLLTILVITNLFKAMRGKKVS